MRTPQQFPPTSLDVIIATGDVTYLASVLRGEIDAEDVDLIDTNGIEIGLQPTLFEYATDEGEVLIEARTPHYHLMGGCGGKLASQLADSIDGKSGMQVPVMLSYRASSAEARLIEVAVFFVAERRASDSW